MKNQNFEFYLFSKICLIVLIFNFVRFINAYFTIFGANQFLIQIFWKPHLHNLLEPMVNFFVPLVISFSPSSTIKKSLTHLRLKIFYSHQAWNQFVYSLSSVSFYIGCCVLSQTELFHLKKD